MLLEGLKEELFQLEVEHKQGRISQQEYESAKAALDQTLQRARAAQSQWREVPIAERAAIIGRFCGEFEQRGAAIATGLSWQMGRPIRFAPSEVRGMLERARYMTGLAATALADVDPGPKSGFRRFVRREPLGRDPLLERQQLIWPHDRPSGTLNPKTPVAPAPFAGTPPGF